ncbi:MAG: SPOR domain-containing protein [Magnetococcales bacterium]|nr:SPOR domain-containing protein [Magnetococcales bacterium]
MAEDEATPHIHSDDGPVPSGNLLQTLKTIRNGLRLRPQRGWGVVFALVYWSMVGTAGITATMPVITLFKGPGEAESSASQTTEIPEGEERPVGEESPQVAEKKEAVQVVDLESPEHVSTTAQTTPASPESDVSVVDLRDLEAKALAKLSEPSPTSSGSESSALEPAARTSSTPEVSTSAASTMPAPKDYETEVPVAGAIGETPPGEKKQPESKSWQGYTPSQSVADSVKDDVSAELTAAGMEIVELAAIEAEESASKALREKNLRQSLAPVTKLPAIQAGRHFVLIESSTDDTKIQAAKDRLSTLGITPLVSRSTYLEQEYIHLVAGPFATSTESIQAAYLLTEQTRQEVFPLIAPRTGHPGEPMDPTKALLPPDDFPPFQDGRFMIVAGSFASTFSLAQAQNMLSGNGILYTMEKTEIRGQLYHRLLVGPYATREQADLASSALQLRTQMRAWVVTLETPRKAVRLWQSPERKAALAHHLATPKRSTRLANVDPASASRRQTAPKRQVPPTDREPPLARMARSVPPPRPPDPIPDARPSLARATHPSTSAAPPPPTRLPDLALPAFLRGVTVSPVQDNPSASDRERATHDAKRGETPPVVGRSAQETKGADLVVAKNVTGQFAVLVGVFNHSNEADHTLNRLTTRGVKYYLNETVVGGRRFVQVLVGPFSKREEAKAAADRVRNQTGLATYCIGI